MKNWRTTDSGPRSFVRGEGKQVSDSVRGTLARLNGGLPPNLQMANRGVLLRIIGEQQEEIKRLKMAAG